MLTDVLGEWRRTTWVVPPPKHTFSRRKWRGWPVTVCRKFFKTIIHSVGFNLFTCTLPFFTFTVPTILFLSTRTKWKGFVFRGCGSVKRNKKEMTWFNISLKLGNIFQREYLYIVQWRVCYILVIFIRISYSPWRLKYVNNCVSWYSKSTNLAHIASVNPSEKKLFTKLDLFYYSYFCLCLSRAHNINCFDFALPSVLAVNLSLPLNTEVMDAIVI